MPTFAHEQVQACCRKPDDQAPASDYLTDIDKHNADLRKAVEDMPRECWPKLRRLMEAISEVSMDDHGHPGTETDVECILDELERADK